MRHTQLYFLRNSWASNGASKQAGERASEQASKQDNQQERNQASTQGSRQAGKQAEKHMLPPLLVTFMAGQRIPVIISDSTSSRSRRESSTK